MNDIEFYLFWPAIILYALSLVFYIVGGIFKDSDKRIFAMSPSISLYCSYGGFVFLTTSIGVRWYLSGHPPIYWTFEHALASAWFTLLVFHIATYLSSSMRILSIIVIPFVLTVLLYGYNTGYTYIEDLPVAYQSNWMWIHVNFAWLAYSSFTVSFVVAVLYLLKSRGLAGRLLSSWLPSLDDLHNMLLRINIFGFIALSIEMGAGAIWAFGLWGRYWAWDPMETWTLICWITYALYLHLTTTLGWKGERSAWFAIMAFVFIFIAFGGIAMMRDLHRPLL